MPKYKYGNMFDELKPNNNLFVITTNSYIRKDGCLVMGRGAAKQLKDRFPKIEKYAGDYIKSFQKRKDDDDDYCFFTLKYEHHHIGFLQVKRFFKDDADLELIWDSIDCMQRFVEMAPWIKKVNINYPGIGFGGLTKKKVKPCLEELDKRFNIWQFKK